MGVAPKPINSAQANPRRAPSLTMVRLTGPTGTERTKPLTNPVSAASSRGWSNISKRGIAAVLLFLLFLDIAADLAGDARADEAVEQVDREHDRQDDRQDDLAQQDQGRDKNDGDDGLRKRAPRPQVEGFEGRILDFAHHHEGEKQQEARQRI